MQRIKVRGERTEEEEEELLDIDDQEHQLDQEDPRHSKFDTF